MYFENGCQCWHEKQEWSERQGTVPSVGSVLENARPGQGGSHEVRMGPGCAGQMSSTLSHSGSSSPVSCVTHLSKRKEQRIPALGPTATTTLSWSFLRTQWGGRGRILVLPRAPAPPFPWGPPRPPSWGPVSWLDTASLHPETGGISTHRQ